jgi:hypothetical protein
MLPMVLSARYKRLYPDCKILLDVDRSVEGPSSVIFEFGKRVHCTQRITMCTRMHVNAGRAIQLSVTENGTRFDFDTTKMKVSDIQNEIRMAQNKMEWTQLEEEAAKEPDEELPPVMKRNIDRAFGWQ